VIIPADFKNEWAPLVAGLGGTSLSINRQGGINLADPGELIHLAEQSGVSSLVMEELKTRRDENFVVVLGIVRGKPLSDIEATIVRSALRDTPTGGSISEFVDSLDAGRIAQDLRVPVQAISEWVGAVLLSAVSLRDSPVGRAMGTASATQVWPMNGPLVVDTSTIPESESVLSAATAVTAWTAAQSGVMFARDRNGGRGVWGMLFDEVWRATRNFPALADQIGGLLRMDRDQGLATILITHSWTDTNQAGGSNILNRCSALMLGGMQQGEIEQVAVNGQGLTEGERDVLARNSVGSSMGGRSGGVGRFLLKIGSGAGTEVLVAEAPSMPSDTNQLWSDL